MPSLAMVSAAAASLLRSLWRPAAFARGEQVDHGKRRLALSGLIGLFDQAWSDATRLNLVVRRWIQVGRLVASQLISIILEENCQPYLAIFQEQAAILQAKFPASGW